MARNRVPDAYLEDLCFEAQQAAEKAIKAVLIRCGIEFPYVHDLARLLTLLEEAGTVLPENIQGVEELTLYASIGRYPGPNRPVSPEEYVKAVKLAQAAIQWAEGHI